LQEIIYVINVYLSVDLAWRTTNDLRYDLMDHCVSLDMTFHNQYKPGEMIERVDGDVNALSNFFSTFSLMVFSNIVLLVAVLTVLFFENVTVGAIFTTLTLTALVSMYYVRNFALKDWKDARQKTSDLMGFIEERLGGTEEIRANDGVEYVYSKYHDYARDEYQGYSRAIWKSRLVTLVSFFVMGLGVTLVYSSGIPLVQEGTITPGTLYLFTFYFGLLLQPIFELLRQIQNLQQADASIERINEIFATKTALEDKGEKEALKGPVDIKFNDLKFAYHEEDYVLQEINFELKKGKTMGLIGKTGSGKTTLSRLIYRLYDYDHGEILIEGIKTKDYSLNELRKMIVIVTQQVELFAATIKENITFFDETISDELVLETIERVGLTEWLNSQPNGLETELKKAGLSAGESQLLAFARAFITNPSIVILDEASSRLDPATEVLIEKAVNELLENRTAIVIAHRLETLEEVDEILILGDGKIKEYGDRRKLVEDKGSYYSHLREVGIEELLV